MAWARAATRDQAMTADDVTSLIVRVHALLPLLQRPARRGRRPLDRVAADQPADRLQPAAAHPLAGAREGRAAARPSACPCRRRRCCEPMPAQGHASRTTSRPPPRPATPRPCCAQFPGRRRPDQRGRRLVEDACADPDHRAAARRDLPVGARDAARSCGTAIAPWFTTCRDCSARAAKRLGPHDVHRDGHPGEKHRKYERPAAAGRPARTDGRTGDSGRPSRKTGTGRATGGRRGRPSRPR